MIVDQVVYHEHLEELDHEQVDDVQPCLPPDDREPSQVQYVVELRCEMKVEQGLRLTLQLAQRIAVVPFELASKPIVKLLLLTLFLQYFEVLLVDRFYLGWQDVRPSGLV